MATKIREILKRLGDHWLGIIFTTVFWCLLWGAFTPLTILGGLVSSILIVILFPLPPLAHEVVLRPIPAAIFLITFIKDITISSIHVSWYALRPSGSPGASVIAVPLHSKSDLFLTFTGVLATLIPGSVVVEAQRSTGTLFFHSIGANDRESVEKMRETILQQEARALMAFASKQVLEEAGFTRTKSGWKYHQDDSMSEDKTSGNELKLEDA